MNEKAQYYIQKLELKKHPEGGYFREIYRAAEMIYIDPPKKIRRNYSTSIYFLLDGNQVSKFHRLASDELWHFYDGDSVIIHIINENGDSSQRYLGRNFEQGEEFQTVIEKNNWFAVEMKDKKSFALVGCTVSPGFDFSDFGFGSRDELISKYPKLEELIKHFT